MSSCRGFGPARSGKVASPVREEPPCLTRSSLALLFVVQCVLAIGNAGMFSAMPSIGRSIGIPDAAVTGIFSLSALLWVLCSTFWARLCGRIGQRSLVLVGLVGFVVSMGAAGLVIHFALAGHFAPWTAFVLLLAARAIFGGFGSAAGPAGQAYAIERSSETQRTRIISTLASGMTAGTLAGPLLTPVAMALWGPPMPFYLFAGLAGITIIGVILLLSGSAAGRITRVAALDTGENGSVWRDAVIRPYLVFALVVMTAQTAQTQTLGFLIIDTVRRPPVDAQPAVALAMALGALAALAGQVALVCMRLRNSSTLVGAALLTAISAGVLALSESYPVILCAFVVQSFGFGLARPALAAAASLSARAEDQAGVAGAFGSINGIAMLVAPIFILIYGMDRRLPFLIAAGALMAICLIRIRFHGRPLS